MALKPRESAGLPSSLGMSFLVHLVVLLLLFIGGGPFAGTLPRITEISLVSGPGGGSPGPQGAAIEKVKPGGRHGTAAVRTGPAVRGQVTVATPDFVPVGRRPRRSGEDLMGTAAGEGGGPQGPASAGPGGPGGTGRKIKYQEPLEYPDWAKKEGVDAKVVLRFKVNPDGTVDDQIIVPVTSGYRQLDLLATQTLRRYVFAPLPHDTPQVAQWGELTFHFKPE
ncbi:MAG: energy transducer TonB [Candidatus Coatesbacteria bacterium]